MALYNSWEFTIGITDGRYPEGATITDSIFKICGGANNIASVGSFGQIFNIGFSCVDGTFYLPFMAVTDDVITVYFKQPVNIG